MTTRPAYLMVKLQRANVVWEQETRGVHGQQASDSPEQRRWQEACAGWWNNNIGWGICSAFGLNHSSKMLFTIIERLWKTFKQGVYILCRKREDLCSCFWIYFIMLKIVWLLLRRFQYFLRNVRLLLKVSMNDWFWKKMRRWYFCVCVAASRNISMFFDINKISMSDCF